MSDNREKRQRGNKSEKYPEYMMVAKMIYERKLAENNGEERVSLSSIEGVVKRIYQFLKAEDMSVVSLKKQQQGSVEPKIALKYLPGLDIYQLDIDQKTELCSFFYERQFQNKNEIKNLRNVDSKKDKNMINEVFGKLWKKYGDEIKRNNTVKNKQDVDYYTLKSKNFAETEMEYIEFGIMMRVLDCTWERLFDSKMTEDSIGAYLFVKKYVDARINCFLQVIREHKILKEIRIQNWYAFRYLDMNWTFFQMMIMEDVLYSEKIENREAALKRIHGKILELINQQQKRAIKFEEDIWQSIYDLLFFYISKDFLLECSHELKMIMDYPRKEKKKDPERFCTVLVKLAEMRYLEKKIKTKKLRKEDRVRMLELEEELKGAWGKEEDCWGEEICMKEFRERAEKCDELYMKIMQFTNSILDPMDLLYIYEIIYKDGEASKADAIIDEKINGATFQWLLSVRWRFNMYKLQDEGFDKDIGMIKEILCDMGKLIVLVMAELNADNIVIRAQDVFEKIVLAIKDEMDLGKEMNSSQRKLMDECGLGFQKEISLQIVRANKEMQVEKFRQKMLTRSDQRVDDRMMQITLESWLYADTKPDIPNVIEKMQGEYVALMEIKKILDKNQKYLKVREGVKDFL